MEGFDPDMLLDIWRERVDSKHVFRGMSAKDLRAPLNPSFDPFKSIRPKLYKLIDVLEGLVQTGLAFTIEEEHFGQNMSLAMYLYYA